MKTDEIIEMARQAGATEIGHKPPAFHFYLEDLEAFAKLVAAKVRKATLEEMIYEHPTTSIEKAVAYEREGLVRIIEANIAAEREACAKVCEELQAPPHVSMSDVSMWDVTSIECADAIRARGEA